MTPDSTSLLAPAVGLAPPVALRPAEEDVVARLLASTLSENTRKTYTKSWRSFLRWWIARQTTAGEAPGNPPMPLPTDLIVAYVAHRCESGVSPSQIEVDLAAFRAVHRAGGERAELDFRLPRQMIIGYRRTAKATAARRGKAGALLVDDLRRIVTAGFPEGFDDPRALRDRAILLVSWSGALRRSETTALRVSDLLFDPPGLPGALLVTLRRSKVDQEGLGQRVVIHAAREAMLCPIAALRPWIAVLGRGGAPTGGDWLWRMPGAKGGLKGGISDNTFVEILRRRARLAGVDPTGLSGHSGRRGWITEAALAGTPARDIMAQSRHRDIRTMEGYVDEATKVLRVPKLL